MTDFDNNPDAEQFDDELEFVSKTQIKKEMHELQQLGQKLLDLKPDQLRAMNLSEKMKDALETAKKINSNSARKRHIQYMGRLMRREDVDSIRAVLEQLDSSSAAHTQHFHALEQWRERLLNEGNNALTDYLSHYPEADGQHLRQLIRNANRELKAGKPPASSRKLFRYLREVAEQ